MDIHFPTLTNKASTYLSYWTTISTFQNTADSKQSSDKEAFVLHFIIKHLEVVKEEMPDSKTPYLVF